jgi:hypothetical protein
MSKYVKLTKCQSPLAGICVVGWYCPTKTALLSAAAFTVAHEKFSSTETDIWYDAGTGGLSK